jgi:protein-tyrosine phosphatase
VNERDERRLPWEGSYNIRDLGGLVTADGATLHSATLVRADNLGHLTPAGQQALLDYGVRTIIDVRSAEECRDWPHAFSQHPTIPTANIPVGTGADAEAQAALDTAADLVAWGCRVLDHCQAQLGAIVRQVAHAAPGGVLIHCHAGKDRTGLAVALLLALAGVTPDVIAADYAESEHALQPLYAQWLAAVADDPVQHTALASQLTARPETMLAVLAYLDERYGGSAAYLKLCGLRETELEAVRHRLRDTLMTVPRPAEG